MRWDAVVNHTLYVFLAIGLHIWVRIDDLLFPKSRRV